MMDQTLDDKAQAEAEALKAQVDEQKHVDELRDRDEARAREDRDRADARAREDRELADRRWREDDDRKRERDAQDAKRAELAKRPRAENENANPSIAERIGAGVAAFIGAKMAGDKETPIVTEEAVPAAAVGSESDPDLAREKALNLLTREERLRVEADTDAHDARLITGGFGRGIGREGYLLLEPGERKEAAQTEAVTPTDDLAERQEAIKSSAFLFDAVPTIIEPVKGQTIPPSAFRITVLGKPHAVWKNEDGELVAARESEVQRATKALHDSILQAAQLDKGGGAAAAMRMTHHE